jgi:hypothetical protein
MKLRLMLYFAAALAIAAIALRGPAAQAFTQENLNVSGDGNSRFADPDDRVKTYGQGARPFGENGPVVQFGVGSDSSTPTINPMGHYNGFNGSNGGSPPLPYSRPLGNGD